MSFQLSATLTGHDQDVRAVAHVGHNAIASASRDGTVRVWKPVQDRFSSLETHGTIAFQSPTSSFINSVAFLDIPGEPLVASGGQDTSVYLSEVDSQGDDSGKYQLLGHQGNVCALHYGHGELISGSWDTAAIVWDLDSFSVKHTLEGHQYSVWDAKVISPGRYLTCSADRTIRVWDGKYEIAQFTGHSDVVRKLLLLPDGKSFASASNDGTIKIWDLETGSVLSTLTGHSSFVYDLKLLPNGDLVSTGEDRTVRVWRNGVAIQVITLPAISVWAVDALENGDIAVGSSDNLVRVFTRESSRVASEDELIHFKESVQQSTISEQSIDDLKKTDIPGYDALKQPGKQEGATIMVKSDEGVIEAHQWSGGEWVKIGDVVGSSQSKEKKEHGGKEWDYVFDVDVEDGKPPLKLPYNSNENPYTAAQRFLAANELPSSYTDEVVKFIAKNTEGFELQQTSGPAPNPYADTREAAPEPTQTQVPAPATPSAALSVIPEKTYITFKDFKPEQLIKGLTKFNGEQPEALQFSSEGISVISSKLYTLNSKDALQLITEYLPKILNDWSPATRLIGYDILRISIPRVTAVDLLRSTEAAEVVLKAIIDGIEIITETTLPLLMLLLKTLNNLIENVLFVQLYIDPTEDGKYQYNEFFITLLSALSKLIKQLSTTAKSSKHYGSTTTALATFVYNLSAYHLKTSALKTNPGSSSPVVAFLNEVGSVVVDSGNTESIYRLVIAYGNLKYSREAKTAPSWISQALDIQEPRFATLASDVNSL